MEENELLEALRRYRPPNPPPSLRGRCVRVPPIRVWPWLAACAATALVALGADRAVQRLGVAVIAPDEEAMARAQAVEDLASQLEAAPDAQRIAEFTVTELDARSTRERR